MSQRPLDGARVLFVEDDFLIGLDMVARLRGFGAEVEGPHADLRAAEQAWRNQKSQVAVLDVNVRGESSLELAEILNQEGVRVVFATGYSVIPDLPADLSGCEILRKPVNDLQLVQAIRGGVSGAS